MSACNQIGPSHWFWNRGILEGDSIWARGEGEGKCAGEGGGAGYTSAYPSSQSAIYKEHCKHQLTGSSWRPRDWKHLEVRMTSSDFAWLTDANAWRAWRKPRSSDEL